MFFCSFKSKQHGQLPSKFKRGHAYVYEDGYIFEYAVPKGFRRQFRQYLKTVFDTPRRGPIKLTGSYPTYHIT